MRADRNIQSCREMRAACRGTGRGPRGASSAVTLVLPLLAVLAGLGAVAQPASAADRYAAALAACRAAAKAADDGEPTRFKCNWRTVLKGAPGAALSGSYMSRIRGQVGSLTILEGGGEPALIAVEALVRSSKRQCTVKVEAARGEGKGEGKADGDALVARPAGTDGCVIRIASSGRNVVQVSAEQCQFFCGMGATFEGTYKLRTK